MGVPQHFMGGVHTAGESCQNVPGERQKGDPIPKFLETRCLVSEYRGDAQRSIFRLRSGIVIRGTVLRAFRCSSSVAIAHQHGTRLAGKKTNKSLRNNNIDYYARSARFLRYSQRGLDRRGMAHPASFRTARAVGYSPPFGVQ